MTTKEDLSQRIADALFSPAELREPASARVFGEPNIIAAGVDAKDPACMGIIRAVLEASGFEAFGADGLALDKTPQMFGTISAGFIPVYITLDMDGEAFNPYTHLHISVFDPVATGYVLGHPYGTIAVQMAGT